MTRRVRRWLLPGVIVVSIGIALLVGFRPSLPTSFQARLIAALEQHFDTEVRLGSLELSVLPHLTARGSGLIVENPDPTAPSPLITIESFEIHGSAWDLARRTLRLRRVEVKGLQVHVPPKRIRKSGAHVSFDSVTRSELFIDELVGAESDLVIDTEKPGRLPLVFHIHQLRLQNLSFDRPTAFQASLINPVPPGEVEASGHFGPWVPDEPRLTPIAGNYALARADLSAFDGLAGHLSSTGSFDGKLERLAVKGRTTTPDFALTDTGRPVKLDTVFDAVVDGTDGDTILNEVTATWLNTAIVTSGRVIKVLEPTRGRLIEINARIERGRLEDVLHLAVKKNPAPMSGVLTLRTKISLPPGDGKVIERLGLDGRFLVQGGQFAASGVQQKIANLSRRGRGEPDAAVSDRVFSNLQGSFRLKNGVLQLPAVSFSVEGARVDLAGGYRVRTEGLGFTGTLRLQAKLSETTTGLKSLLLKALDPLFKGNSAGTELPITVQGTADDPKFSVDIRRALTRK